MTPSRRRRFDDGLRAYYALRDMARYPGHQITHGEVWVDIDYPRMVAVETLQALLETQDCAWGFTIGRLLEDDPDWCPNAIVFDDPKFAVMFRLMLP